MSDQRFRSVSGSHCAPAALCAVSLCAAFMCAHRSVLAAVGFNPLATVSATYNSNVFARPADEPPFAGRGNTALGDVITRYLVAATADFAWGNGDKLSLNGQGSRFQYNRFSDLNHYESKFGGDLNWYLGSAMDGTFTYSQSRIMAPLADSLSEQLEIQTEKLATAIVRVRLTPRWRFDLIPKWHDFESPLQQFPQFGFKEQGASGGLYYLGTQKLTAGLREDYLHGEFHHIVAATKYDQNSTELTANYAITGFSSLDAEAGYTQRRTSLVNPADSLAPGPIPVGTVGTTNAFTGVLGFRRQISVKTSVDLRLFREVNSYVAGANSEIGTGGEVGARWDPDVKLSFRARYRYTKQSIQGALAISAFAVRTDKAHHGEFSAEYHALRWLTLRPYAMRDTRSSNYHQANFNSTLVGVDFTAQLHPPQQ